MTIKFACPCGRRMSAPDGSSGRRVRCPNCQEKMPVPGAAREVGLVADGSGAAASLGSGVAHALKWDDARSERRAQAGDHWLAAWAEQFLTENGMWVPAGLAAMAATALVATAAYAFGIVSVLPVCGLFFFIGLGSVLYGRYGED